MERLGQLGELDDFGTDISHYNYVLSELARDTKKTVHEVLEPFDEMVEYIYRKYKQNPDNWGKYFALLTREFSPEFARFIYAEVSKKAGQN